MVNVLLNLLDFLEYCANQIHAVQGKTLSASSPKKHHSKVKVHKKARNKNNRRFKMTARVAMTSYSSSQQISLVASVFMLFLLPLDSLSIATLGEQQMR
jgi:hypothetical protein